MAPTFPYSMSISTNGSYCHRLFIQHHSPSLLPLTASVRYPRVGCKFSWFLVSRFVPTKGIKWILPQGNEGVFSGSFPSLRRSQLTVPCLIFHRVSSSCFPSMLYHAKAKAAPCRSASNPTGLCSLCRYPRRRAVDLVLAPTGLKTPFFQGNSGHGFSSHAVLLNPPAVLSPAFGFSPGVSGPGAPSIKGASSPLELRSSLAVHLPWRTSFAVSSRSQSLEPPA